MWTISCITLPAFSSRFCSGLVASALLAAEQGMKANKPATVIVQHLLLLFFICPPLSAAFLTADDELLCSANPRIIAAIAPGWRGQLSRHTPKKLCKGLRIQADGETRNDAVDGGREIPVSVEFSAFRSLYRQSQMAQEM